MSRRAIFINPHVQEIILLVCKDNGGIKAPFDLANTF